MECFQCFPDSAHSKDYEANLQAFMEDVKMRRQLRKSFCVGKNKSGDKLSLKKADNSDQIVFIPSLKPLEQTQRTGRCWSTTQNRSIRQRAFFDERLIQHTHNQPTYCATQSIATLHRNISRPNVRFTNIGKSVPFDNLNLPYQKCTHSNTFQQRIKTEALAIKNTNQNQASLNIKILIKPIQNSIEMDLEEQFHKDLQKVLDEETNFTNQVESSQQQQNKLRSSIFSARGNFLKPECANTQMVSSRISRLSAPQSIQDVACIKTESVGDSSQSSSQFSEIIVTSNNMKKIKKLGNSETKFYEETPELTTKIASEKSVSQRKPSFKKSMSNA